MFFPLEVKYSYRRLNKECSYLSLSNGLLDKNFIKALIFITLLPPEEFLTNLSSDKISYGLVFSYLKIFTI